MRIGKLVDTNDDAGSGGGGFSDDSGNCLWTDGGDSEISLEVPLWRGRITR